MAQLAKIPRTSAYNNSSGVHGRVPFSELLLAALGSGALSGNRDDDGVGFWGLCGHDTVKSASNVLPRGRSRRRGGGRRNFDSDGATWLLSVPGCAHL